MGMGNNGTRKQYNKSIYPLDPKELLHDSFYEICKKLLHVIHASDCELQDILTMTNVCHKLINCYLDAPTVFDAQKTHMNNGISQQLFEDIQNQLRLM